MRMGVRTTCPAVCTGSALQLCVQTNLAASISLRGEAEPGTMSKAVTKNRNNVYKSLGTTDQLQHFYYHLK